MNWLMKFMEVNYLATKNNKYLHVLNRLINNCDIHSTVFVPKSIHIGHNGCGTIIGVNTKIGENVTISHNVTIGTHNFVSQKSPVICDNVTIYPNAVIVGDITIGKNSIIGAMSFVDRDIPPNSIVYGNRELVVRKC